MNDPNRNGLCTVNFFSEIISDGKTNKYLLWRSVWFSFSWHLGTIPQFHFLVVNVQRGIGWRIQCNLSSYLREGNFCADDVNYFMGVPLSPDASRR